MSTRRRLIPLAAFLPVALLAACTGGGGDGRGGAPSGPSSPQAVPGEALVDTAEAAIRRGDTRRALAELARAIEVNPTLTKAHMNMGDIYRTDGDYASAQVAYHRAAESQPRNFDAQYYDGLMLHLLNRVSEAVGAYLRALAVRPNDFDANLKVSTAYYQLEENTLALEYAKHAVEIRPSDGAARLNLGAVYAASNNHAGAVREFQQAAELMPLNSSLLLNMAQSLGRLDRYAEMRNTLEQLLRTEPSAAAHERLGFAYFKLGDADRSLAEFRNALKLDTDYYPALNGAGVCSLNRYLLSDQKENSARLEAIEFFRHSLQVERDQPKVLELLSRYGR